MVHHPASESMVSDMIVYQFCYFGSIIAKTVSLETGVSRQIGKAVNIFGKLTSNVWQNKFLTVHTKVKIYEMCILSSLLHGSETWISHAFTECKLNSFHICYLRKLLGLERECQAWGFSGAVVW